MFICINEPRSNVSSGITHTHTHCEARATLQRAGATSRSSWWVNRSVEEADLEMDTNWSAPHKTMVTSLMGLNEKLNRVRTFLRGSWCVPSMAPSFLSLLHCRCPAFAQWWTLYNLCRGKTAELIRMTRGTAFCRVKDSVLRREGWTVLGLKFLNVTLSQSNGWTGFIENTDD